MIIPNHIEYRELEIRVDHPEIWQHLATRVDLAKNVRSVRITRQITSSKGLSSLTLANFQTFMKKRTQLWKIHRSKCLQPFELQVSAEIHVDRNFSIFSAFRFCL